MIVQVAYHPFDNRVSYFTGRSKGFMAYPRSPLSNHCLKANVSLLAIRNNRKGKTNNFFISNKLVDKDGVSPLDNCKFFPLYLYPDNQDQQSIEGTAKRIPNLNKEIVNQIAEGLGLSFVADHEILKQVQHDKYFSPLDLLDYIYAVLHSPTYRDTYKEFLKIDFPRVPYPTNTDTFWQLVELGGELRQIHLLEHPVVEQYITQYPKEGDNVVTRKLTKTSIGYEPITDTTGKVWINDDQYFDNVPLVAWEFYIGGYQPAQKWLKDRKGRELNYEDILHYQKIIVALTETDRIMKGIDGVDVVEESL